MADQLSKSWIRSNLASGQSLPEEGILRLTHITNTGSVFGIFPNHTFTLAISATVVIVLLLLCYRYLPFDNLCSRIALGLLLGGSMGNLIDRVRLGHVTDFIDIQLWHDFHWPAFNFADSAIVIGTLTLAALVLFLLREPKASH